MTNARQMPGGKGWPRLELTEPLIEIFLISNCFTYIVEGETSVSIEIGCVFQFVFLPNKVEVIASIEFINRAHETHQKVPV